jgi:hypothetical protein
MSLNVQMKVEKLNLFVFLKILKAYFEVFRWLQMVLNTDEYIFRMIQKVLLSIKRKIVRDCLFKMYEELQFLSFLCNILS